MSEDDDPAYGTDDSNGEQYGGTEDHGDDKRSAGGEDEETDENDDSLGQDETAPE